MNIAPKSLPRIIQAAIEAISSLPDYIVQGVFAVSIQTKKRRAHKLHKQRRVNLQKLLTALLRHSDIASGKLVRRYGDELYDITVEDLVQEVGVCRSSLCDMLSYLKKLGLLVVAQQNRACLVFDNSTAQFSASAHRSITSKFWKLIGLEEEYQTEQSKRAAAQVKHRCSIKGTSGVHSGRALPIPSAKKQAIKKEPQPLDFRQRLLEKTGINLKAPTPQS